MGARTATRRAMIVRTGGGKYAPGVGHGPRSDTMAGRNTATAAGREIRYWDEGWTPNGPVVVPNEYAVLYPGDTFVTRRVKEMARDRGLNVYARMKKSRRKAYSAVVFYRVPADLLAQARRDAEESEARRRASREAAGRARERRHELHLAAATNRILEMYPGMPNREAASVAERAFEVGSGRVGRAGDLDLDAKLRLAVQAHARHAHTEYDRLLDVMDREDARAAIRGDVAATIRDWERPPAPASLSAAHSDVGEEGSEARG
jgi:hypothetical protein